MQLPSYSLNGTAQRFDIQTPVSVLMISGTIVSTTAASTGDAARDRVITALSNARVTITKYMNGQNIQLYNNIPWSELFDISAASNRMTTVAYAGGSETTYNFSFKFFVPISLDGALYADKTDFITIEDTAGAVSNNTTTLTINYLPGLQTTNRFVMLQAANVLANQTARFDVTGNSLMFVKAGTFTKLRLYGISGGFTELTNSEVEQLHLLTSDLAHNVQYLNDGFFQNTKDFKVINVDNVLAVEIDSTSQQVHWLFSA